MGSQGAMSGPQEGLQLDQQASQLREDRRRPTNLVQLLMCGHDKQRKGLRNDPVPNRWRLVHLQLQQAFQCSLQVVKGQKLNRPMRAKRQRRQVLRWKLHVRRYVRVNAADCTFLLPNTGIDSNSYRRPNQPGPKNSCTLCISFSIPLFSLLLSQSERIGR